MISRNLVSQAVEKKLSNQLLFAVVNEAFMNGLPIDKSAMSKEEERKLQEYTWHVLEAFGGIDALEAAVDFENKTPGQNLYLGKIYDVCTEAARAVAKECSKNCDNGNYDEIVGASSLSPQDYAKFNTKKNSLNLDKVADIIKEKTLKVIRDEQDQYEKEQDLDKELKDALQDAKANQDPNAELGIGMEDVESDDPKAAKDFDKAKESMININLGKFKPRNHVTVFSRFQNTAMEMMDTIPMNDENDYMPYVYKISFEAFLKEFNLPNYKAAMEAVQSISNEEVCAQPGTSQANPKMATLVSIIVYTMMETLKTMGIFCPSKECVQNYVNHAATVQEMMGTSSLEAYQDAAAVINLANQKDYSKMSNKELSMAREALESALESVQKNFPDGDDPTKLADTVSVGISKVSDIDNIIHRRDADMRNAQPATESMASKRLKASDIAQFNRLHYMYSSNPLVANIQLIANPGTPSVLTVDCANEAGTTVRRSYMTISYPVEFDKYADYLSDTFAQSKLADTSKGVSLIIDNGYGKHYTLK